MTRRGTSSPESRAAQARLAVADREAERARAIADEYKIKLDAGTATPDQSEAAWRRAERLADIAEEARRTWTAERYIAGIADAVTDRPKLNADQLTRIAGILADAGLVR